MKSLIATLLFIFIMATIAFPQEEPQDHNCRFLGIINIKVQVRYYPESLIQAFSKSKMELTTSLTTVR